MKRIKHKSRITDEDQFDISDLNEKIYVKQSYDKKLTTQEKQARNEIVDEEKEYKNKIEMLRKKKEREREERLERIKKMKIN
jgi:hypothetical protein